MPTPVDRDELRAGLLERAYEARVPVAVTFELTYGCNLRCLHCLNPTHAARGELTAEEAVGIIDGLAGLGTLFLTLTGGEPLTRRDLPALVAAARAAGMHVTLLTNATRVDEAVLGRLMENPPDQVNVSLYGATAAVYDAVTGMPGSFEAFRRGFGRLRTAGVPLVLTSVVLRENAHEVGGMRELSQALGVHFRYTTAVNPRQDGAREPLAHRLEPAAVLALSRALEGEETGSCASPASLSGPFYCNCARASAAVTPYGRMNFCVAVPFPQADARHGRVAEAWRALVELRDRYDAHPTECAGCELFAHCERGAHDSLLEAGDLGACVPYFREMAGLRRGAA